MLRDVGTMIPEAEGVFETQFLVKTSTDNILDDAREALMLRNLRALQEVDYLQDHAESLASRTKELEETNRRDALTGLFNRGYLDRFLEFAFKEASEREEPLSIAFADLDKFKSINDTYGHQIGDQILVTTANILKSSLRGTDIVAAMVARNSSWSCPTRRRICCRPSAIASSAHSAAPPTTWVPQRSWR